MQAFAKEEARRLATEHPEWNWTNVPAYEKSRVRDSINAQLRREGVPELGEDIIRWRMSICIRDVKQWAGMLPRALCLTLRLPWLTHPLSPPVNKNCMPKRSSAAAASPYHHVPPSRPYDPIRDF